MKRIPFDSASNPERLRRIFRQEQEGKAIRKTIADGECLFMKDGLEDYTQNNDPGNGVFPGSLCPDCFRR